MFYLCSLNLILVKRNLIDSWVERKTWINYIKLMHKCNISVLDPSFVLEYDSLVLLEYWWCLRSKETRTPVSSLLPVQRQITFFTNFLDAQQFPKERQENGFPKYFWRYIETHTLGSDVNLVVVWWQKLWSSQWQSMNITDWSPSEPVSAQCRSCFSIVAAQTTVKEHRWRYTDTGYRDPVVENYWEEKCKALLSLIYALGFS